MRNKYAYLAVFFFYLLNINSILGRQGAGEKTTLTGDPKESRSIVGFYIDNEVENSVFLRAVITKREGDNTFHLFTHGRPGQLLLEGEWRDAKQLGSWLSSQLNDRKHLNIYGCNFGYGEEGRAAVAYLKNKLGVTVSASDDITGKDGDWELEVGEQGQETLTIVYEGNLQCTDPNKLLGTCDYDGDGVLNNVDLDDDNDGVLDSQECRNRNHLTGKWTILSTGIYESSIGTTGIKAKVTLGNYTNFWDGTVPNDTTWDATCDATTSGAGELDGKSTLLVTTANNAGGSSGRFKIEFINGSGQAVLVDNPVIHFGRVGGQTAPYSTVTSSEWVLQNGHTWTTLSEDSLNTTNTSFVHSLLGEVLDDYLGSCSRGAGSGTFRVNNNVSVIDFNVRELKNSTTESSITGDEVEFIIETDICNTDSDKDGIPNDKDLDSDGDGCSDAIEGGDNFDSGDVVVSSTLPGGNSGTGYIGTSPNPVKENLGTVVDASGVPTIANGGQEVGDSQLSGPDVDKDGIAASCDPDDGCTNPNKLLAMCDFDGDGKKNVDDLDDDNDGVLDSQECSNRNHLTGKWTILSTGIYESSIGTTGIKAKVTLGNYTNFWDGTVPNDTTWDATCDATTSGAGELDGKSTLLVTTANNAGGSSGRFKIEFINGSGQAVLVDNPVIHFGRVGGQTAPYSTVTSSEWVLQNGHTWTTLSEDSLNTTNTSFVHSLLGEVLDDYLGSCSRGAGSGTFRVNNNVSVIDFNVRQLKNSTTESSITGDEVEFIIETDICNTDSDKDGIPNDKDLDSDGDGCSDAIEGGGNFDSGDVVVSTLPGGNTGTGYIGTSPKPVKENLGNGVDANGVPTIANGGQGVGDSQISGPDADKDGIPTQCDPNDTDPCQNTYTTPEELCKAITAGATGLGSADCDKDGTTNKDECTPPTGTPPTNPLLPCLNPYDTKEKFCQAITNGATGLVGIDCDGDGVTNNNECIPPGGGTWTNPKDPCDYNKGDITVAVTADQTKCVNPCTSFPTPEALCMAVKNDATLGGLDCDGDGSTNKDECTPPTGGPPTNPTKPCSNPYDTREKLCRAITNGATGLGLADCDEDGESNTKECTGGTDPNDPCSNSYDTPEKLCKAITNGATGLGLADCDKDGESNAKECTGGTDPNEPCSNSYDTKENFCRAITNGATGLRDIDCDDDGVVNKTECVPTGGGTWTNPKDPCDYNKVDITVAVTADQTKCAKSCTSFTTFEALCLAIQNDATLGGIDCDGDGVINKTECVPPGGGPPTDPTKPCIHNVSDRTLSPTADLSGCCPIIVNDPLVNTHPTVCGSSNGTIKLCGLAVSTSGYTLSYVLNGGTAVLVSGQSSNASGCITLSNLVAGSYTKIFVKSSSCAGGSNQLSATLSDPDSPNIGISSKIDPSLCGSADGSFTITSLAPGTTYKLSYKKDGVSQTSFSFTSTSTSFLLSGLAAGLYTGITVTSNGCSSNGQVAELKDPTAASITSTASSPSGCQLSNATMTINGLVSGVKYTFIYSKDGIDQQVFTHTATSSSYKFEGLNAGDYRLKVRSGNCNSNEIQQVISDPGSAVIAATGVNPTLCDATDGSYTITGLTEGLTYTLNFVKDGIQQAAVIFTASSTSHKVSGLSAGVYSGINVTQGGCKSNTVQVNLTDPAGTQISAIGYAPTSCSANDGRIQVVGLIPGVSYILKYSKDGVTQTDIPFTATGTSFELQTLVSAKYTNIRVDQASCISNSVSADFTCNPCLITFTDEEALCNAIATTPGLGACDYDKDKIPNKDECTPPTGTPPTDPTDPCSNPYDTKEKFCMAITEGATDLRDIDCDGDGVTNKDECIPPTGGTTTEPKDPCDFNKVDITKPVTDPGRCGATLNLKVMLQGALLGNSMGIMRDDLRKNKVIPSKEPYTVLGGRFQHVGGGGETLGSTALDDRGNDSVVDWVFVELRDGADSSKVVQTVSALVQRDGDVVSATDGTSSLTFPGRVDQKHFVSVRHRNHLGAMTNSAITLVSTGTVVDFTTMSSANAFHLQKSTPKYDGFEQTSILGVNALWAGNVNNDRKVKNSGVSNDRIPIFVLMNNTTKNPGGALNTDKIFPVYMQEDVNMDAKVKYNGTGNDPSYIFTNVVSRYKLNTAANANYDLFVEQLP